MEFLLHRYFTQQRTYMWVLSHPPRQASRIHVQMNVLLQNELSHLSPCNGLAWLVKILVTPATPPVVFLNAPHPAVCLYLLFRLNAHSEYHIRCMRRGPRLFKLPCVNVYLLAI